MLPAPRSILQRLTDHVLSTVKSPLDVFVVIVVWALLANLSAILYKSFVLPQIVVSPADPIHPNWEALRHTFFAPLWEEVTFRYFPLSFAIERYGRSSQILQVAVLSSVLFAFAHYGGLGLISHLPIAFGLQYVYLRTGGATRPYWKGLITSTIVHILCNSS